MRGAFLCSPSMAFPSWGMPSSEQAQVLSWALGRGGFLTKAARPMCTKGRRFASFGGMSGQGHGGGLATRKGKRPPKGLPKGIAAHFAAAGVWRQSVWRNRRFFF